MSQNTVQNIVLVSQLNFLKQKLRAVLNSFQVLKNLVLFFYENYS